MGRVLRFRDDERGMMLVEVVVSAMILVVTSIGTLSLIEGAQSTAGTSRTRSVAAQLAEQDQDRMRGMPVSSLSGYSATRTVTVGTIPYTVVSSTTWITDRSASSTSCTTTSSTADYLRLTSTVSTPVTANQTIAPITVQSILNTPPSSFGSQGGLAVQVNGASGNGQASIPVSISGPQSVSSQTNTAGCAVFGYLTTGSYTAYLNSSGYVDPSGTTAITASSTVSGGNVNQTTPLLYDQAATVNVSAQTQVNSVLQTTYENAITVANSGLPANNGTRVFTLTTPATTVPATNLYPFTSGYTVYTGNCAASNPSLYVTNYFSYYPGQVTTNPGSTNSLTVQEPALNIVAKSTGTIISGAHVIIKQIDSGCTSNAYTATTNSYGQLYDPGLPYGHYQVCVDNGTRHATLSSVANIVPAGTSTQTINIPSGTSALGVCT